MLLQLPPLRVAMWAIDRPLRLGMSLGLVQKIGHPSGDWLNHYLRALALQEFKHVEVAIALGNLCPEFTGDLHHGLHLGTVDLDAVHVVSGCGQGVKVILPAQMFVHLAEHIEGVTQNLVALAQFGARSSISKESRFLRSSQSPSTASRNTRSVSPLFTSKGRT